MSKSALPGLLALSFSLGLLHGQTTTVNISSITSSYTISMPSGFTGQSLSTLRLGLYYPAGLASSSYIPIAQLTSDFQGFVSAYPSPSDAPEAYLSVALQGILTKYPSIQAGTLSATVSSGTGTASGVVGFGSTVGSIGIAIGNFNPSTTLGTTIVSGAASQNVKVSAISSTWIVTMPTGFAGQSFSTVTLGVNYPTGLASNQYITSQQLNTDFQGFITAYPNPADPPEALLSTSLQGILNKYPQMPGGTLTGSITGAPISIGGVTIPGTGASIGSITVEIGTFNFASYAGLVYSVYGAPVTINSISSTWTVMTPTGFTGQTFSTLSLGVLYQTGLPAASYVLSKQLNSDFQASLTAYPNPSDAPEAYLSVALQSILNKYTQIPFGSLTGAITGAPQTIGGVTIPGTGASIGTITIEIGNYSTITGLIPASRSNTLKLMNSLKPEATR